MSGNGLQGLGGYGGGAPINTQPIGKNPIGAMGTPVAGGGGTDQFGGTAPVAIDPNNLFPDPANPGYYTDGRRYFKKNADGSFTQSHDLDPGSQVARALGLAGKYSGGADPYAADFNDIFASQNDLAGKLNNTITNPDAPSVAREQLNQALTANVGSQLSGAAGTGGENGFIARENAMNNIAGLGANTGQQQALLRAQEVNAATGQLNNLLGTQSGEASGMFGTNANLGLGYTNSAAGTEGAGQANSTAQRGQNIGIAEKGATAGGSALGSLATSSGTPKADPNALAPVSFNEQLAGGADDEYTKKLKQRGLYA